jgi:hypothetical protein
VDVLPETKRKPKCRIIKVGGTMGEGNKIGIVL